MGTQEHRRHAGNDPVTIHLVIVSTSRSSRSDEAGPLMERMLVAAGHHLAGRDIVPDDPTALAALLDDLLQRGQAQAIILSGGTGISARDGTYEVVSARLDKVLPGFGELFRMLSYQQIGSAAYLSRATCGICGTTAVFAIPGSPAACRLALQELILPELRHLLYELQKEPPLTTSPDSTPSPDSTLQAAPPAEPHSPWQAALTALGGRLESGAWPPIPEPLASMAPVRNVLEAAGQRGVAIMDDGTRASLFGYPDLLRPASKVLLVQEGAPLARIVALHRYPRWVALASEGHPMLPGPDTALDPLCQDVTGRPAHLEGTLFAQDGHQVFAIHAGRVTSWDGRRTRQEGPTLTALASLVLRWSQR